MVKDVNLFGKYRYYWDYVSFQIHGFTWCIRSFVEYVFISDTEVLKWANLVERERKIGIH